MAGDDGGVRSVKETSKSVLMDGTAKGAYGVEFERLVKINEVGQECIKCLALVVLCGGQWCPCAMAY